ncbi:MAG: DNA adenine methylase [bacterium]
MPIKNNSARPFLKWAGGKTQLIDTFQKYYPAELKSGKIKQYIEPFLGSGAVFFDVVKNFDVGSAFLGDINDELILVWRVIQNDVEKLIGILERYARKYKQLDNEKRKQVFYDVRKTYNQHRFKINYKTYSENWVSRAAQLIFLNRTCFNGLFRMNSKGEFNTPTGDYKNPKICDAQNLFMVAEILQIAEIRTLHFTDIQKTVEKNSFVYFDPPYRPLSKTAHFTSYSRFQFNDEQQIELAKLFTQLDKKQSKLMLSNSDPKNVNPQDDFFDDLYKEYNLFRVKANRMINSDKAKRGPINEILVTNYRVTG